MSRKSKWGDLSARAASAVALGFAGLGAIWMGGLVFYLFVAIACGLMVWELVRMLAPEEAQTAIQLGVLSGGVLLLTAYLPHAFALPLLIAPGLVGISQLPKNRVIYVFYTVFCLLAGAGLLAVRTDMGFGWMLWLVLVVMVTDVFGYFAGKAIGGRKFWPQISPNKTWSGTIAGWVGAGIVGICFVIYADVGWGLVPVSIAASMAAQLGDIAESAIKRRMGVKDSSNLIPGHGGLLDRFDGLLGASVFVLLVASTFGVGAG